MLVDSVTITVRGGKGGDGAISFHREKYRPKGGPDGGNGGKGGDVYIRGVSNIRGLKAYRETKNFSAQDGVRGGQNKKHGQNGKDLTLTVPIGSRVIYETGKYIDILDSTPHLIAKGGKGGIGNWEFRTPTLQTPHIAKPGSAGEKQRLTIKLMVIAHVGIIGLPNAGKTSLLNALTRAQAKVGAYPFTTLEPNLGSTGEIILADIPGLIEGSSNGKGLGIHFLQHTARTQLLLHCIAADSPSVTDDYRVIRNELAHYSSELAQKPEVVVITKSDLAHPDFPKALYISVHEETSLKRLVRLLKTKLTHTTSAQ